VKLFIG